MTITIIGGVSGCDTMIADDNNMLEKVLENVVDLNFHMGELTYGRTSILVLKRT